MSSSTSILTTERKSLVAYSVSILSEDRNFSPLPDLLFIPSKYLCSECLELRTEGAKQREQKADHVVVLSGDIKSDWRYMPIPSHISRALCLIKHKNSIKFLYIFNIILSSMFNVLPINRSLKTIMNTICFKKDLHLSSIVVLEAFANLRIATVIAVLFFRLSAHPNGTTGLPKDAFS
jgi:hypothetical protein